MKNILLASALLVSGVFAADTNLATNPVPREGGWVKRHESFNEISKKGEATLVFLGDSITQGWEGKGKATWEKFYAKRNAANFGIGGDRTEHVLWRLDNGNFDGLKPKLIVLMIGTNNTGHVGRPQKELNGAIYESSAEQTAEGVKLILEKLKAKAPAAKILVLGIFPRGETPADAMRQQNEKTNAIIATLADGKTVFYQDIGKTFLQPDGTLTREIMPDLLHLSEKGYDMWAEAIEPKIKELLGE
ncbi:beta-glucosidase [Prosthecobacter fusiformis]|uniref:Beta-glucosidase n=1 Tax=Prosthecobacter fusiformis TaxID=48464 RepID=A0A4R7RNH4_9BACT|nr:platelet-activating factor acetylhydrolase IB subunit [Prosthecobacter fusiformis]TDU66569.1 beta-glucosidase [Prosthecobacter fusiformis]